MVREEWGVTDEEITSLIKGRSHHFYIEICGSYMGCGVIYVTVVFDNHVSQFYSELQGVLVGLKVAIKYKIRNFSMICTSEAIPQYVMRSWEKKNKCRCPARDDTLNAEKKKYYCVECSRSSLDEYHEGGNAGKILPLIDEIFYDALEFKGFINFNMSVAELSRAKAVCYLANSGMDQDLSLPAIEEDEKLIEILYKDVFGHVSEEEVLQQQQLMLQKQ
ncbi:hypothetical protein MKW92_029754 [Papaver armeniacum]|nr:hypothetical protein MKW92_029754 [Papaver armeniacum]